MTSKTNSLPLEFEESLDIFDASSDFFEETQAQLTPPAASKAGTGGINVQPGVPPQSVLDAVPFLQACFQRIEAQERKIETLTRKLEVGDVQLSGAQKELVSVRATAALWAKLAKEREVEVTLAREQEKVQGDALRYLLLTQPSANAPFSSTATVPAAKRSINDDSNAPNEDGTIPGRHWKNQRCSRQPRGGRAWRGHSRAAAFQGSCLACGKEGHYMIDCPGASNCH